MGNAAPKAERLLPAVDAMEQAAVRCMAQALPQPVVCGVRVLPALRQLPVQMSRQGKVSMEAPASCLWGFEP